MSNSFVDCHLPVSTVETGWEVSHSLGSQPTIRSVSLSGRYRQRTHPALQVLHPDTPFDSAPKAYLLPKGDIVFSTVVNTWLESEIRTGRSNQLLTDWIG